MYICVQDAANVIYEHHSILLQALRYARELTNVAKAKHSNNFLSRHQHFDLTHIGDISPDYVGASLPKSDL